MTDKSSSFMWSNRDLSCNEIPCRLTPFSPSLTLPNVPSLWDLYGPQKGVGSGHGATAEGCGQGCTSGESWSITSGQIRKANFSPRNDERVKNSYLFMQDAFQSAADSRSLLSCFCHQGSAPSRGENVFKTLFLFILPTCDCPHWQVCNVFPLCRKARDQSLCG